MFLAATKFGDALADVGEYLTTHSAADVPIERLTLYQIAARAAVVYLGGLIVVRIGKSRLISRTTVGRRDPGLHPRQPH